MYLGQIVEVGGKVEVFDNPRHPYTQALLAAVPRPDPTAPRASGQVRGEIASPLAPPSGCRFHPRCPHAMDAVSPHAAAGVHVETGEHSGELPSAGIVVRVTRGCWSQSGCVHCPLGVRAA